VVLQHPDVRVERGVLRPRQRVLRVVVGLRPQTGDEDVVDRQDDDRQPQPGADGAQDVGPGVGCGVLGHGYPSDLLSMRLAPVILLSPSETASPTTTRTSARTLALPMS